MMLLLYVVMFALAGAATYATITRRIDEVLGGAVAAMLWGRLTPAAFSLTAIDGGGTVSAPADGGTAILTATFAVLMVVFVIGSAFDYIPDREQTRFTNS